MAAQQCCNNTWRKTSENERGNVHIDKSGGPVMKFKRGRWENIKQTKHPVWKIIPFQWIIISTFNRCYTVLYILCFAVDLRHFHLIAVTCWGLGWRGPCVNKKQTNGRTYKYWTIFTVYYPTGFNEETGSKFKVALCDAADTAILLFKVTLFQVFVCKLMCAKGSGRAG